MNFKKLAVLFSAATMGSTLLLRWFNRPQPFFYEFANPSVILVAVEELGNVERPSSFYWSKDVSDIVLLANTDLVQKLNDSWIEAVSVPVRNRENVDWYQTALQRIFTLSQGTKILIVTDAKTLGKLRRNAAVWSDSPELMIAIPILYNYSRTDYLSA